MRTVTRRGFLGGWLGLGMASCLSPTLPPLPPPSAPQEMSYLSEGQLQLSGSLPKQRGLVFALNLANNKIAGEQVRARRYSLLLDAQPGDAIELWYIVGDDQSDVRRFPAPDYSSSPSDASSDVSSDAGVADSATHDATSTDAASGDAASGDAAVETN